MKTIALISLCAWAASVGGETLTWNGTDGGAWGGAARNWMDEAGQPCAWKDGAEAVFAGSGCRVRAAKGVKAASVRFRASGVCLEGEAEIPVFIADGGTSNTVAFADMAPRVTVRGGGMIVCAARARFGSLDIEEGFVRIADDGVAAKVNVGEAGCLNLMKDLAFEELAGAGRIWRGELPSPRIIPFKNDFDSGLSTNKTYTHLYDFGPNPTNAVANFVKFNRAGGVITVGMDRVPYGSGNLMRMENVGVPRHHGLYHLFSDFAVGFEPEKPLRFKRLKKGHWHRITIYQRAFEQPGNRRRGAELSFDMDGDGPIPPATITTWQNLHPVSRIEYDFFAVEEDALTLRIRNLDPAMGFHLYGLSIEVCEGDGRYGEPPSRRLDRPCRRQDGGAPYGEPPSRRPRDLMSDTWAAVDGLNRTLPDAAAVGAPRADRSVGIFYWTWHRDARGPYDNMKLTAGARDGIVSWPPCASHWWGESEYGYYRADDEYVLTHHAILLAAAGVDAVLFDTTNPPWTFKEQYEALCRAWTRLREQGTPTPQIAFICPFPFGNRPERAEITLDQLWYDLYRPGKWKDLWYCWKGKPLILADPRSAKLPGMKEFFTFRYPEADYRRGPTAPNQWSWLEVSPQHVFTNDLGEAEQMSVGVAVNALPGVPGPAPMSHKDGAMGRSWHDGKVDPDPAAVNRGIFFQNQWDWALKHDPLFVFVTGWNEWRAGRMTKWSRYDGETDCYFPGGLFVDEYNQEYSRDCEPMKGGHGDNYYYQLVANIRRYKGARPAPAATCAYPVEVDGAFADWTEVQPEFRDAIGDTVHRDHAGCGENIRYSDASGRNDIADLKVAETPQGDVAFYAKTANHLSPHTDPNWMLLFVNVDAKQTTGWYGYDLRVNRDISADGTTASLDMWRGPVVGGYWECVGRVPIRIGAREIELVLPRARFGTQPLDFQFHWKDNPESLTRLPTLQGDDAPERRFNYVFRRLSTALGGSPPLVRLPHRGQGLEGRFHPTYASVHDATTSQARAVPAFLRGSVMYQLFTRMFTPEGTFAAARAKLPELKADGIDIIYLTPHQLADDDPDPRFWSARQRACRMNNPKNPYRQKDFFAVDPEYGTKEDLRAFVAEAHRLGMKVMFDLVYFHCGPTAVFLKDHPEFIVRNPDGTPKLGEWAFPEMDIAKPAVREYLYANMVGFVRDYGADGFRCDVADMLPVEFWEEGYRRCKALKPDVFMMCEGLKGDDQIEAFDLTYGFYTQWTIVSMLEGKSPASLLEKAWRAQVRDYPRGFHWMRCFENHDFANVNPGQKRKEALYGHELNAAMIATCFLLDGIPMLYNGQEIADASPHSIWSNRDHGKWCIDWSRAGDKAAIARRALIRRLTRLRHAHPDLFDAPVAWHPVSEPDKVYAFSRPLPDGTTLTLAANISRDTVSLTLPVGRTVTLPPHAFDLHEAWRNDVR